MCNFTKLGKKTALPVVLAERWQVTIFQFSARFHIDKPFFSKV